MTLLGVEVSMASAEHTIFAKLEWSKLAGGSEGGTDRVRLEPFAAIEIELEALWPTAAMAPK
jgi:hypothetical protein